MSKLDLTVSACIVSGGRILLMHHTKLEMWLFPGGHIDPNETPDEALVREVKEETSLDLEFAEYSSLKKAPQEIKKLAIPFHANTHNVGDHDHYCVYYLGTAKHPNFVKNKESKDMKWVGLSELNNLEILPSIKQMAVYAIKNINKG